MRLTIENYLQTYQEVAKLMPAYKAGQLKECAGFMSFYHRDETIKRTLDALIETVNIRLAKLDESDPEPESEPEPVLEPEPEKPVTTKPKKPKTHKQPKEKPAKEPEQPKEKPVKEPKQPKDKLVKQPKYDELVNKPSLQVRLAARFVKLHGKNFTQEVKDDAKKILFALQKAIINREIRKEGYGALSAYAAEMRKMQDKLVKMCNAKIKASSPVQIEGIEDFRKIARSEGSRASADAMRTYARLATKNKPTKKEAETALNKVDKVVARNEAGDYADILSDIRGALSAFISGDAPSLLAMEQTLEGIKELCGDVKKKRCNQ